MIDDDHGDIERAVESLEFYRRRLDQQSRAVVMTTIGHVALAFAAVSLLIMPAGTGLRALNFTDVRIVLLATDLSFLVLVVTLLSRFDRAAKLGEIVFTEIANENNWRGRDQDRLRFNYRITLRQFSLSRELPLARGTSGVPIYLLVNILVTTCVWILLVSKIQMQGGF